MSNWERVQQTKELIFELKSSSVKSPLEQNQQLTSLALANGIGNLCAITWLPGDMVF